MWNIYNVMKNKFLVFYSWWIVVVGLTMIGFIILCLDFVWQLYIEPGLLCEAMKFSQSNQYGFHFQTYYDLLLYQGLPSDFPMDQFMVKNGFIYYIYSYTFSSYLVDMYYSQNNMYLDNFSGDIMMNFISN